jgi:hypothetical protein
LDSNTEPSGYKSKAKYKINIERYRYANLLGSVAVEHGSRIKEYNSQRPLPKRGGQR